MHECVDVIPEIAQKTRPKKRLLKSGCDWMGSLVLRIELFLFISLEDSVYGRFHVKADDCKFSC